MADLARRLDDAKVMGAGLATRIRRQWPQSADQEVYAVLQQYEFGEEAIRYIRTYLPFDNALWQHLLRLPLESGRVVSYLPPGIDPVRARAFEMGRVIKFDPALNVRFANTVMTPITAQAERREIESHLIDFIAAYLGGARDRVAVFIDALRSLDDEATHRLTQRFVHHNQQLYFFVPAESCDTTTILNTMREAGSYFNVVALTHTTNGEPILQDRALITQDAFRVLAENTEHLIVSAYDMEGELIWSLN